MLGRKNKLKIAKNKKAKASTALVSLCVNFINNYKGSIAHPFLPFLQVICIQEPFVFIIRTFVPVLSLLQTSPSGLKKILWVFLR